MLTSSILVSEFFVNRRAVSFAILFVLGSFYSYRLSVSVLIRFDRFDQ